MKKRNKRWTAVFLTVVLFTGCTAQKEVPKDTKPTTVEVWNYYNGPQKEKFDRLVQNFNETVGMKEKIYVEAVSKGTLGELIQEILDSAEEKIGSDKLPDLCFAYGDTALELDNKGLLADIGQYLSDEERNSYVDAYLEEGYFSGDGSLKLLPIVKSTEVLTVNMSAWESFSNETGASLADLSTWEGIARTAELYYQWTDDKTEELYDGKAFFGRDALANYLLVGSSQLGHELVQVKEQKPVIDFDQDTMKKLWDFYYLPYIKGYYLSEGKFRSDDLKMGSLIAYVGSTSGALYTPEKIIYEDGSSQDISCQIFPVPNFEGTEPAAVQQGGGMVLFQGEEKTMRAAMEFLKWFTQKEVNLNFCKASGYLPVQKEANSVEFLNRTIEESEEVLSQVLQDNLLVGMQEVNEYRLYVAKPFQSGNDMRKILAETLENYAKTDRETIRQMVDGGMTPERAVEKLNPEQRFEAWYSETQKQLEGLK